MHEYAQIAAEDMMLAPSRIGLNSAAKSMLALFWGIFGKPEIKKDFAVVVYIYYIPMASNNFVAKIKHKKCCESVSMALWKTGKPMAPNPKTCTWGQLSNWMVAMIR